MMLLLFWDSGSVVPEPPPEEPTEEELVARFFVEISSALKTKLSGVGGLNGVYEYEIDKPEYGKYPFVTITMANFEGAFGDNIRNLRTYGFNLRFYQERAAFGNEKAERIMREMMDEVTTAFDADTTLSGLVKYVKPVSGDLTYVDREIGDTRFAEIVVEAMSVVPSSM